METKHVTIYFDPLVGTGEPKLFLQKELDKLSQQGWTVSSVTEFNPEHTKTVNRLCWEVTVWREPKQS